LYGITRKEIEMRTKFRSGDVVYIKEGICAGEYATIRAVQKSIIDPTLICIFSNSTEVIVSPHEVERVANNYIVESLTKLKKIRDDLPSKNTVNAKFDVGDEVRVNAGPYEGCKVEIVRVKHPSYHNTAYDCKLSNSHKISVWEHMIHSIAHEDVVTEAFRQDLKKMTTPAPDHSDDLIDAVCKAHKIPRRYLTGEGLEIAENDVIVSFLQKKQLSIFARAMINIFATYAELIYPEPKPENKSAFPMNWKVVTATTIDDLRVIQERIWNITHNVDIYQKMNRVINELERMV
jgi:transcription antitermination factor NusG